MRKLHRKKYPPEYVEGLLEKQIKEFSRRIRALTLLQWTCMIMLIAIAADIFTALIWRFTPVMPGGEKYLVALVCVGAIWSAGWAMCYIDELRDDAEISLEKLMFGEESDTGEGE